MYVIQHTQTFLLIDTTFNSNETGQKFAGHRKKMMIKQSQKTTKCVSANQGVSSEKIGKLYKN